MRTYRTLPEIYVWLGDHYDMRREWATLYCGADMPPQKFDLRLNCTVAADDTISFYFHKDFDPTLFLLRWAQ